MSTRPQTKLTVCTKETEELHRFYVQIYGYLQNNADKANRVFEETIPVLLHIGRFNDAPAWKWVGRMKPAARYHVRYTRDDVLQRRFSDDSFSRDFVISFNYWKEWGVFYLNTLLCPDQAKAALEHFRTRISRCEDDRVAFERLCGEYFKVLRCPFVLATFKTEVAA